MLNDNFTLSLHFKKKNLKRIFRVNMIYFENWRYLFIILNYVIVRQWVVENDNEEAKKFKDCEKSRASVINIHAIFFHVTIYIRDNFGG